MAATDSDALVIGAGPAGAATAILLRLAGWRVVLVEKSSFPRQKVCGECLTAGSLSLLDALGVGPAVAARAGPDLRHVGWIGSTSALIADLPACASGVHRYGRALGRDVLDTLLVDRASVLGVIVLQPARVSSVRGDAGNFSCEIQSTARPRAARVGHSDMHRAAVVVDAHGSWDAEPSGEMRVPPARRRPSDLFGFKASFADAALPTGVLPVIAFPGGYGGMVLAEDGRATVAGCIRRDFLHGLRGRLRHASAGEAFERHLRDSCPGMQAALTGARRMGNWLSVGPLRLGSRVRGPSGLFRVGNAAGETHPLIGEGMSMALESAFLLASHLTRFAVDGDSVPWIDLHRTYETAWRAAFAPRMRVASAYAHLAMQPVLNAPTQAVLRRWPSLLTKAARLAGKARPHHLGITPEGTS